MEITIASETDWPRIIDIYNHAVVDGRCTADIEPATVSSRTDWLKLHTDKRYPILLAESAGTVVGWCSLSPWRPGRKALTGVAEISYYIDRQYRRKGIADQLLVEALDYAARHRFRHLIAILLDNNLPSLKLLKKHGFQRWGTLPGIVDFGTQVCGQYIYGRKLFGKTAANSYIAAFL